MDLFSRLAAAIETHLRTAFPATIWSFALVPEPMGLKEWTDLARNTPLITLAFKSFKPATNAGRRAKGQLTFVMIMVVKNERGASHRFLGDARGPGLFPATDMLLRLMQGASFPDLGTTFVTSCEQSFADQWSEANAAMVRLEIETTVEFDPAIDPATLDEFLRIQTQWTPPSDNQVLNVINVRDPRP